jgi:hypothetical protein
MEPLGSIPPLILFRFHTTLYQPTRKFLFA